MAQLLTTVPLAVPTPVQPANTPIFPPTVMQPNLAPVTDISVNTTPDDINIVESQCDSLEIQTRRLGCNKDTAEDSQKCVISCVQTVHGESQIADACTVECQTQASDPNLVAKSKALVRGTPQDKRGSLDEKKLQEQKALQEKKIDNSLSVKKISRFQVSVVQEDTDIAGVFHCLF
jgi:hypothetical protein